jgi:tetratricopeptide (TPR) repeat protein
MGTQVSDASRDARHQAAMGDEFFAQGKYDDAAACCVYALILQPDLAEAHYRLGEILQLQGRSEEALSRFQRAVDLNPALAGQSRRSITSVWL